jgi:iron(III) transport system substrate-binding protein
MATLIKTWSAARGVDYFRKLSALSPDMRRGHILLANLVAAGEVPVGLTTYDSNIVPLKRKGAPVAFVPVQPVVARPQGRGEERAAPAPACRSAVRRLRPVAEGQRLFESLGCVPASTKLKKRAQ